MDNCALEVKHVTKEYKLYESEMARLKEAFHPFRKFYHKTFFALNDINIRINKGEKVGIIGANGAGKSTLLKIITGVLNPTKGELVTHGRVAALLELGAGFNQDYTGIENIRLNGVLMGDSARKTEEKIQQIMDFADIGDFIYQPVKSYSSGMFVRLAFATQIFSDPDILIVDEALSVGDIRFQQKCYRAMDSLMEEKTVVLVTHDTAAVTRFCDRIIWINKGQVMYDGDVAEGLEKYQEFLINKAIEEKGEEGYQVEQNKSISLLKGQKTDIPLIMEEIVPKGNGDAAVTRCALFNEGMKVLELVEPGQMVSFISHIEFYKEIERPLYGLTIRDRLGNEIVSLNSEMMNIQLPKGKGKLEYQLKFRIPPLNKGIYTISVAVANGYQEDHVQLCWLDDVWIFRVADRQYDLPGFLYIDQGEIIVTELN